MSKIVPSAKAATELLLLVASDTDSSGSLNSLLQSEGCKLKLDSERRMYDQCGVCKKKNQPISYYDADAEWELPGHPDHLDRAICKRCQPDYYSRGRCAELVYEAMRVSLGVKGISSYDIDCEVRSAQRRFDIELDSKALVKAARRFKIKHQWLKGKRSK